MLSLVVLVIALAVTPGAALAEASAPSPKAAESARMPLFEGLGPIHHPVTTESPVAQKYFDQGLALTYGFNHDAAEKSFREAARIDPSMAMAYWGTALVLGPNYNLPGDTERGKRAVEALQKAQSLKERVTPPERDYIDALAKRYGEDGAQTPERDRAYADAMRTVAQRHPEDPDAQVLFAESLMNLHPWALWSKDGSTPGPDTVEIIVTLEKVLQKHPDHTGANHYYIHTVEGSSNPARATASADRLRALAPEAGHLVHMPAHIYLRTGRYHDSAETNEHAIEADRKFLATTGQTGVYPMLYATHNVHFLWYSQMMEGRKADAMKAARELEARTPIEGVREMPMMEFIVPVPLYTMVRFGEWNAILSEPAPPADLTFSTGIRHYSRGVAFAAKGKFEEAAREKQALDTVAASIPKDRTIAVVTPAHNVLEVASVVVAGEILSRKGEHERAIVEFRKAVVLQDALPYEEPPVWFYPVRESLAAEMLATGDLTGAEAVYREDLKRNPANPRALNGLSKCLAAQGKNEEAAELEKRFRNTWRYSDIEPERLKIAAAR